ncbi:MAG: 30S ribosomal protein S12 methylthiotransferase RimO [Oscillospiraceae bacterium]|nr:30S ribosomal protein S12 methylthiotransferase RimO [Oscillospiraceae bacterium]
MTNVKIGLVSLGCSKNQVDAERMIALLRADGFELCADAGLCDVVIINTCGFIEDAKKESIDHILEFAKLKEEGRVKAIVITGCLAERYQEQIGEEFPEADVILGIGKNGVISDAVRRALGGGRVIRFGEKDELSLEGDRILANLPFYAYLKIADGCDNRCSYCAIPMIRGGFRSRKIEDVTDEAKLLVSRGVTELNLVAQDTTRYGLDIYGRLMLPELLNKLCEIENLRWLRVLYCYPENVTGELLSVMAKQDKIVKYIDVPLQHVSARVLRDMNRRGDPESLAALIGRIRESIPGVTIRTTLITGFPGETDEEFGELSSFVEEVRFDRLGCFTYSQEEDTKAAELPLQLDEDIKQRRAEVIMDLQMDIQAQIGEAKIGGEIEVLCEGYDRIAESWFGRSAADAPDIDTKVFFTTASKVKPGDYVTVRIEDALDCDLLGVRV